MGRTHTALLCFIVFHSAFVGPRSLLGALLTTKIAFLFPLPDLKKQFSPNHQLHVHALLRHWV